ncbi:hypothetical protein Clacol_006874 [Clathrus columnatus]|uniref:WD repeat-containing protein 36 n=1 Tax=Clathrus columnatus TaxID=1419009 RepID=A0AAV5ADB4_9AGAM|nr:hypothetical protein Clacol_006874 [Clathrus columnatus]
MSLTQSSTIVGTEESSRPRKKPRTKRKEKSDQVIQPKDPKDRLFAPFRALGFVTNHVPFVLQVRTYKGSSEPPRLHILTCLGKAWALWEGGKMTLLFVGPDMEESISALALDGDAVWAAHGSHASKYLRGKEVSKVSNPLGTRLSNLTIFGSQLLSLTEDGRHLLMWSTETYELLSTIAFDPNFTATCLLHPATYLNKVIVGSSQGSLQLWNIRTRSCIYSFSPNKLQDLPATSKSLSPVTVMVQSPAIDVIGIGFASGEISIYDIRADERLMRIYMDGGAIRDLSFRNDNQAVLASASSTGHIALWDLNNQGRLLHIIRGAHDGPVAAVEWIPAQPVLISSGDDNSVKQWLFDSPTAPPRLLKFRAGHHAPPHLIRYYGDDGKQLLTASRDRSLRYTSVVRDSRSYEFSQGWSSNDFVRPKVDVYNRKNTGSLSKKAVSMSIPVANLKFSPVTCLSFSNARSKDWDDVLTGHAEDPSTRSWSVLNKKHGNWTFDVVDKGSSGSVKSVCVSACGNFGIAGSSKGAIHMWNMQSGIKRKTYSVGAAPPEVVKRGLGNKKEERVIVGLASDVLDRVLVACTLDGTLNFFNFHNTALEDVLVLPSTASHILLQRDSNLLAIICDDLMVRIVDIETRRIVRELTGFRGRILDITFSHDSRWLIVASMDSIIRTFDIPTGRLIDAFRTASIATSLSFSPTGDFLATSHVDSVGVYLWANRAQYAEVSYKIVSTDDTVEVGLPSLQGLAEDDALEAMAAMTLKDETDLFVTPNQLDEELITLTLLPRSRWQTLLNLELIQQRNKPTEPPKPPEKAPFFIPTLPGLEPRFDITQKNSTSESAKAPRRLDTLSKDLETEFSRLLTVATDAGDCKYNSKFALFQAKHEPDEDFFVYMKKLLPAAIDLEIRTISSLDTMQKFLQALLRRLSSHKDFEAVQTLLSVCLRIHADILIENDELEGLLSEITVVQKQESDRIAKQISSALGILDFIRAL